VKGFLLKAEDALAPKDGGKYIFRACITKLSRIPLCLEEISQL